MQYIKILCRCVGFAVVLVGLVVAADLAFRCYEARHLVVSLETLPGPYDLRALGYHQHGDAVHRETPADVYRILSLGDSFAYSITLPEYTYAAVLEQSLRQPLQMARNRTASASQQGTVEVVNLGVPSVSFPEYLRQGRFWGRVLEHDAVVLNVYAGNDFHELQGVMVTPDTAEAPAVQVGVGVGIPRKHLLRFMDYLYAYTKTATIQPSSPTITTPAAYDPARTGDMAPETYRSVMRLAARAYAPSLQHETAAAMPWCREVLRFLAEEARQGRTVRVLVSPPHFWLDAHWLQEVQQAPELAGLALDPALPANTLRRLAAEEGLDPEVIIDLLPALQQAASDEPLYLGTNSHWTVAGNAVAAEVLRQSLAPAVGAWSTRGSSPALASRTWAEGTRGTPIAPAKPAIQGPVDRPGPAASTWLECLSPASLLDAAMRHLLPLWE